MHSYFDCILAVKSKTFFPAVPVTRSAIPAAVTVLITARDTGLNETISLCCLDRKDLPAKLKYDESSIVIHHFLPRCSLLPLTSHLTLPYSLQLLLFFTLHPLTSTLFTLILHFLSPLYSSTLCLCINILLTPSLPFPFITSSVIPLTVPLFPSSLISPSPAPAFCLPPMSPFDLAFFYHLHAAFLFHQ